MITLLRIGFVMGILLICVLSLTPEDILPDVPLSDYTVHTIAYAAVTFLGILTCQRSRTQAMVVVGMLALGGGLEVAQLFTLTRSGEISEFGINCFGVIAATISAWLIRALCLRLFSRQ